MRGTQRFKDIGNVLFLKIGGGYTGFLIFKQSFYLEIMLDLQKKSKDLIREFPYIPHPICPNLNILYYRGTFIQTKKPTLVHYY